MGGEVEERGGGDAGASSTRSDNEIARNPLRPEGCDVTNIIVFMEVSTKKRYPREGVAVPPLRWILRIASLCLTSFGLLPFLWAGVTALEREGPLPSQPSSSQSLKGYLLVATPGMGDPRFSQTVIYILGHGPDGAMGLIVNRPIGEVDFAELFAELGLDMLALPGKVMVHFGGPVEMHRGFLLHSVDVMLESSQIVADGVAVSTDPALLNSIAREKGPRHHLFALGYAGWAPQQLESEIDQGAWLTLEAEPTLVFPEDPEKVWQSLTDQEVLRL